MKISINDYKTWDEAFKALAPVVRQQSVRIAEYSRAIYEILCEKKFAPRSADKLKRFGGRYAETVYKCGLYHQIGKALVPQDYQIWNNDFSLEEKVLYFKYPINGRDLVAHLQDIALQERQGKEKIYLGSDDSVQYMMIRETCERHMERWDGTGFPLGLKEVEIGSIAQIVRIAKEFDTICCERKSERPFEEAFDAVIGMSGSVIDPDIIAIFQENRERFRLTYKKFEHYSMALPKTIPLVIKRENRPMGLSYRAIMNKDGEVVGYNASPWFGGKLDESMPRDRIKEISEQLVRMDIIMDMSRYFLYEAGDTLLRIENCKFDLRYLVLEMLPNFYTLGDKSVEFEQFFKDQPISGNKLILTVPAQIFKDADNSVKETVKIYADSGIQLMIDEWHPSYLSMGEIKNMGIKYLRLDKTLYYKEDTEKTVELFRRLGIKLCGKDVMSDEERDWLVKNNAELLTGMLMGHEIEEEELIKECFVRERTDV